MQLFKIYPNLTVIIASFFWGTYWIPLRFLNENSNNSIWPIFLSFLILSFFLIKPLLRSIKNIFYYQNYFFILGCLLASLAIVLYSESLLRGEIAKVVILFYLCPIWGTIFAKIILNHKFTISRIISIFFGIIGLGIIIKIDKGVFYPSSIVELIALAAGVTWALSLTFFSISKKTSGIEKTSITSFLIPTIYLIVSMIPGGRDFYISDKLFYFSNTYIWILLFATVWLLPSILLTYFTVEILDPGRINILLAFEVIVGIFSAAILTIEIIGIREILGAFFVISACFIDVFYKKSQTRYP